MKSTVLIFLLFLSCMYLSTAQGFYGDCCLDYIPNQMKTKAKKNVQRYIRQETDGNCNIQAVVFFMKRKPRHVKQQTVCTNPNDQWVQDLMRDLDQRN